MRLSLGHLMVSHTLTKKVGLGQLIIQLTMTLLTSTQMVGQIPSQYTVMKTQIQQLNVGMVLHSI